jgi:hypothetical protein
MLWELAPLIALGCLCLGILGSFSLPIQQKKDSFCDFLTPLFEFDFDIKDFDPESVIITSKPLHPRTGREIPILKSEKSISYKLGGTLHIFQENGDSKVCSCLSEALNKTENPGQFGKMIAHLKCAEESCLTNYSNEVHQNFQVEMKTRESNQEKKGAIKI